MSNLQLSPQQLSTFHERGILKIDPAFDAGLLDDIIRKVEPNYSAAWPGARIRSGEEGRSNNLARQFITRRRALQSGGWIPETEHFTLPEDRTYLVRLFWRIINKLRGG